MSKLISFQSSRFESEIDGFRNASSLVQLVPARVSPFEFSNKGIAKRQISGLFTYCTFYPSKPEIRHFAFVFAPFDECFVFEHPESPHSQSDCPCNSR